MFLQSSYAGTPPTNYGHQISPTSGHSFPIFGLGGVYQKGNKQVFVKPVLDEKAALAEMRSTEISRRAHGLEAPQQRIVVIRDPLDTTRTRRFLALESDLDPKFVNNQPMGIFNEEQYFRQLVASLLRVDKDLSGSNVFGNVVADAGPAGVFSKASGLRNYEKNLPSMEDQALINLLGIRGGAKRAFAESTLGMMAGLTPQQYHQKMLAEIQKVIPRLKETIASFKLTDPTEVGVYDDMIRRLEQALGVDWSKFHTIHSAVKPAKPKAGTQAAPLYLANGIVSVPGPKGAGDVTPAMLSPGEAVIPTAMAKKYAPLINAMIAGNIPGYNGGVNIPAVSNLKGMFGQDGSAPTNVSHSKGFSPREFLETARGLTLVSDELRNMRVRVVELTTSVSDSGQKVVTVTERFMTLGEAVERYNPEEHDALMGGKGFGATGLLEGKVRNQEAYNAAGISGGATNLEEVVQNGDLAAIALARIGDDGSELANQLRILVQEGEAARIALSSVDGVQADYNFVMDHATKVLEQAALKDTSYKNIQEARNAAAERTAIIQEAYNKVIQNGGTVEEALAAAKLALKEQIFKASKFVQDEVLTIGVGPRGTGGGRLRDIMTTRGVKSKDGIVEYANADPNFIGPANKVDITGGRDNKFISAMIVRDEAVQSELRAAEQRALGNLEAVGTTVDQAAAKLVTGFMDRITNAFRKATGMASPAEELINVGSNAGSSLVAGAKEHVDDAKRVGENLGAATVEGAASAAKKIRRISTDPEIQADIDRRNQGVTQSTIDSANIAAGRSRGYKSASREGDLEVRLREQAAAASVVNPEAIKAASEANLQNLQKMSMSISAVSFGLSSLTGVLSSFGVDLGGIMPVISGVTGALFALSAVTSALTQAKSAAIISERIAGAGNGAGGIGALFTELKGGAKGFKGFKNVIGRVAAAFGRMFPVISKLIIPLGIVATLFAGWELYNRIQEEARLKIEGLGDVATLTSEKINKLGGIFGVTPTATPLESVEPIISATGDVAADQRSMTQQVLDSEGFAEDYKNEIATISKAGKEEAELALKALAFKLSGKGFAKDQIDGIVSALVTEAKRTDVKIEMGSIDLNIDTNQEILNAQIEQQMQVLSAAYQTSHRKMMDDNARENENIFGLEDDFFGDSVGYTPEASSGVATLQIAEMKRTLDEDLKTSLATLGGVFQSLFIGLSGQLASGTISVGQFNLKFEELSQKILDMPEPEALVLMESVIKNLPGDMQNLINGLSGVADQMILIKAASAGVVITPEQQKAIEAGSEDDASDTEITAKNKALEEITKTTTEYIELINQGTKVSPEEALMVSTEELDNQSEKIRDQIFAYDAMTLAGFSAAEAIRLMGNEALVASIKQNGMTAETIASARQLLDLENQLRAITSAAGGGQKSAFQEAMDSLKEQRQEIKNSISAYAGLRSAGLGVAEASEIAKDSMLAAALASQKVGSAKWNQLVTAIRAARAEEEAWLQSTPEGRAEHFAEVYGKVMDVFSAQEAILDMNNEAATAANRKIIETLEKQIDAYERRASELQRDLDKIAEKEDEINKAYDEKTKALEKVKKLNQDITNQQKSQLSIADALSRGDISAAASAVEDSRAQFASSQGDATQRGFDAQRDAQLNALTENGKTRAQIEAEIKQIKKDISVIEFGALQNARDAVERADELTKAAKENLTVQGKTKTEWENINTRIDASKANAALYETEVAKALLNAQGLVGEWSKLNDTFTTTHVVNTVYNGAPAAPIAPATGTNPYAGMSADAATAWAEAAARRRNAKGGYISGPGNATSDSIPAMLSDGEYVIKAASVNKFGKNFLDSINAGKLPGFKKGGMLGRVSADAAERRALAAKPVGRVSADAAERRAQAAKPAGKGYDTPAPPAAAPTKSMTEKILDVAEKISPLVAMAREGFAIAGSLGNLGRGKATAEDYLTLGLGALNFIPGGRGVSAGVKAARQGSKNIPALKNFIDFKRNPNEQVLSNPEQVAVMDGYVRNAANTLFGTNTWNRSQIDNIIKSNSFGIPKGTPLVRVANESDTEILKLLRPGQSITLDRFMSVTNSSSKEFLEGMAKGTVQTGGRRGGAGVPLYPIYKFNVKSDIPGIQDINRILPTPASNVVDGLLARGQNMKLMRITTDRKTGQQTYHFDIGKGIRAKTGFQQLGGKKDNQDMIAGLIREGRPDLTPSYRQNMPGLGGYQNRSEWMPRYFGKGGLATNKFAMGGLVSPKYFAKGGLATNKFAMGGLVSPKYFAEGGMAQGTDTIPAMLSPGEFVVNKKSTDMYGPLLAAMNSSPASNLSMMGAKTFSEPVYNMPSREYVAVGENTGVYSTSGASPSQTTLDNSVYNNNSYSISVNVSGTSSNANDIANAVMNKIKTIESQQVKRQVLR
jgi:hypothetical protein